MDMGEKKKPVQWKNTKIKMCISYTFVFKGCFMRIFQLFQEIPEQLLPTTKKDLVKDFVLRSCLSTNI